MARKVVQQELTRAMIMDAARDLFVKNGYRNVSMRQIAKQLNYSHGAIYYHFTSKAELFFALVEEHFYLLDEKLDKILATTNITPKEKLERFLLGFIEFGLTNQSHYEIMFLIKDEEMLSYINEAPNKSYEKFAQCMTEFNQKSFTIQEIWSIFLALHGFIVHYIGHVTKFEDVEALAKAHIEFLLK